MYRTWDHPETGRGNYAPAPLRHNHQQHLEQECPGPGPGTADQLWGSTPRKNPSSIRAEQFITISAVSSVSSVSSVSHPQSVPASRNVVGGSDQLSTAIAFFTLLSDLERGGCFARLTE